MPLPDPLVRLIEELQRLPGVGPKGAQRLAFFLLKTPREQTDRLVDALHDVKEHITYCSECSNIHCHTSQCNNMRRNRKHNTEHKRTCRWNLYN